MFYYLCLYGRCMCMQEYFYVVLQVESVLYIVCWVVFWCIYSGEVVLVVFNFLVVGYYKINMFKDVDDVVYGYGNWVVGVQFDGFVWCGQVDVFDGCFFCSSFELLFQVVVFGFCGFFYGIDLLFVFFFLFVWDILDFFKQCFNDVFGVQVFDVKLFECLQVVWLIGFDGCFYFVYFIEGVC